jgi:hypothetical protein
MSSISASAVCNWIAQASDGTPTESFLAGKPFQPKLRIYFSNYCSVFGWAPYAPILRQLDPVWMPRTPALRHSSLRKLRCGQPPASGDGTSVSAVHANISRKAAHSVTTDKRKLLSNLPDQLPVSRAEVDIVSRYFTDVIVAALGAANDN